MSRRPSAPLSLRKMRNIVQRLTSAEIAVHEARQGSQPPDWPRIATEMDAARDQTLRMLERVIAERAELVTALTEAIELYVSLLHSDYTGREIDAAEKGEIGDLRAVVAKYEVKKVTR